MCSVRYILPPNVLTMKKITSDRSRNLPVAQLTAGFPVHHWGRFMKAILKMAFALAATSSLSACVMSTKAYVDPTYHHTNVIAVHRLAEPIPVRVTAQFQTNGSPTPTADIALKNQIEQALLKSGVFVPTADAHAAAVITVTANDTSDLDDAHRRGFHTGFTLGSSGSMIDDNYDFTIAYRQSGGHDYQALYKHAIHTAFGEINGPTGVTPTTLADAFHQVVGDVVLNFIQDLQHKGLLAQ